MGERKGGGAVGEAIGDIRSKIIDEAWFGRRGSTPAASGSLGWEMDAPKPRTMDDLRALQSFEEAWATRDRPVDKLDPDYDLGIGIER